MNDVRVLLLLFILLLISRILYPTWKIQINQEQIEWVLYAFIKSQWSE